MLISVSDRPFGSCERNLRSARTMVRAGMRAEANAAAARSTTRSWKVKMNCLRVSRAGLRKPARA
jgi:hypothetical protein